MPLQKIISSVQMICEAIASVVNIDVTIVDKGRIRLAGTGRYSESVGDSVGENSAFNYALTHGIGFVIENPGEHQACNLCDCKLKCTEHAEVCCPIMLDGEAIGVIGLIAFQEDQRQTLIGNKENLMSFLDRMADLIASKVKEYDSHEALDLMARELEIVVDSLDTSLIAMDCDGVILRTNRKFDKQFKKDIARAKLSDVLSEDIWKYIKSLRENSKNNYYTFDSGLQCVYDVHLIRIDQQIKGYVLTVKTIEEVMHTFSDMMLENMSTGFEQIIGTSKSLMEAKKLAEKVAMTDSTVLILGESGTGKELFARAIHHKSQRAHKPFVAINCAAIPDYLLESELFGYEEGAFTGAKKGGKPGKFQIAHKGTLFLDEIGDMPLHLQAKLLRVLQEKKIDRIGGHKPVSVDVRIIAATHDDLDEKVIEGTFRQDLYYRLNVIPIVIPPLRNRKDDLVELTRVFIKKWCDTLSVPPKKTTSSFNQLVMDYDWKGNVRELENAIEYAVTVCDSDELDAIHLPKRIYLTHIKENATIETGSNMQHGQIDDHTVDRAEDIEPLETLEKRMIIVSLKKFGQSGEGVQRAAEALGISRATLYRKMKSYEL